MSVHYSQIIIYVSAPMLVSEPFVWNVNTLLWGGGGVLTRSSFDSPRHERVIFCLTRGFLMTLMWFFLGFDVVVSSQLINSYVKAMHHFDLSFNLNATHIFVIFLYVDNASFRSVHSLLPFNNKKNVKIQRRVSNYGWSTEKSFFNSQSWPDALTISTGLSFIEQ